MICIYLGKAWQNGIFAALEQFANPNLGAYESLCIQKS